MFDIVYIYYVYTPLLDFDLSKNRLKHFTFIYRN